MEIGRRPVHYDYRREAYVLSDSPGPEIVSVANVVKRDGVLCVCRRVCAHGERGVGEERTGVAGAPGWLLWPREQLCCATKYS